MNLSMCASCIFTAAIIDDDASIGRSLARLLDSYGMAAHVYHSAEAFMEAGVLGDVDCVVADMKLPGMSGLELKNRTNALDPFLPFILLTAYDTPDMRLAAKHAGVSAFFRKPVDGQALVDAVLWACGSGQTKQVS